MIKLERTTTNEKSYHLYFNTVYLGDVFMDESGYYNFWPSNDNPGFWSSYNLKLIAEQLDELNKEWNQHLKEILVDPSKELLSWEDIEEEYYNSEYPVFGGPFTNALKPFDWLKLFFNVPKRKDEKE